MKNLLNALLFCLVLFPASLDAQDWTGSWWNRKNKDAWNINGSQVRLIAFSMRPKEGQRSPSDTRDWVREAFLLTAKKSEEQNRNMNFGTSYEINPTRREIDRDDSRIFVFGFYDYTKRSYAYRAVDNLGGYGGVGTRGFGAWDDTGRPAGRSSDQWSRATYNIGVNHPTIRPKITLVYGHHAGNTGKMRIWFEYKN